MKSIKEKLAALRLQMKKQKINAYIIPTNGPHMSEYPAAHWSQRTYISGFTGSAGTVVVTDKKAALWTDARYFQQAEQELKGSTMDFQKMGVPRAVSISSWLKSELKKGGQVGAAGLTTMQKQVDVYKKEFANAKLKFKVTTDLIGAIWTDRPAMVSDRIFEHELEFAGKSRGDKLKSLRKQLKGVKADATLITALDEIGWLLNLRGSDVLYNPVFYAYLWVERKKSILFVDTNKIKTPLLIKLGKENIEVVHYSKLGKRLKKISKGKIVAIDKSVTNAVVFNRLKADKIVQVDSPTKHLKAIKNDVEIRHLKQAMVKDGVALAKAFYWLEHYLKSGHSISEYDFGLKLAEYRSQQAGYFGESFNPIVGYQANGALMHYKASKDNCSMIKYEGVLLVDSGGQYVDGTTDITRTFAFPGVTAEQRRHYTLVLKGHIALAKTHFPPGTNGIQLDALARQFLWRNNLDFGHGTGHGVGFFMNVHEPPQGFANKLTERGKTVHKTGMYSSNEPGYYLVGSHGIRLENLVICVSAGDHTDFLRHESITLYPFDLNFIDRSLMTNDEVAWLNSYHRKVEKNLSPHLSEHEAGWMKWQCRAID